MFKSKKFRKSVECERNTSKKMATCTHLKGLNRNNTE